MKKLLMIIVLVFLFINKSFAESNCLKMINRYVPDDNMIKLVHLTNKSLIFYINNIRNMKDVDIQRYGFDDNMASQMEEKYNCPKTKFIKVFDSYGMPKPVKINGKLLKDYVNQVIVLEK